jgi:hypothetical protein
LNYPQPQPFPEQPTARCVLWPARQRSGLLPVIRTPEEQKHINKRVENVHNKTNEKYCIKNTKMIAKA